MDFAICLAQTESSPLSTILIGAAVIGGLGAFLAALLVLAEKRIANYGSCEVNINKGAREFETEGGGPLLSALTEKEVFIPSACGGRGTCGFCKAKVKSGGGPVGPTEKPFLSKEEMESDVRLSCQVKIRGPIEIEIPKELLEVKRFKATVSKITDLTYDIKLLRFDLIEPEKMEFAAGQYVQLYTPKYRKGVGDVYRAYSIASNPAEKDYIELIIRRVPNGICTTWVFDYLKEGDEVQLTGPYGEFMLSETDADILYVAGGSGMAPIISMLHQMRNENIERKAYYFFGANSTKDLFLTELLEEFEKDLKDFTYVPSVTNPEEDSNWQGKTGLVTNSLNEVVPDCSGSEGYLCGSPGMIDATVKVMTGNGMPEEKIYYDKFS